MELRTNSRSWDSWRKAAMKVPPARANTLGATTPTLENSSFYEPELVRLPQSPTVGNIPGMSTAYMNVNIQLENMDSILRHCIEDERKVT